MAVVIVETNFERPMTDADLAERGQRTTPCRRKHNVRWIHSYLSSDRRRMICHFEAADAESVRMAHRTAGVVFHKVWTAALVEPDPEPKAAAGS